MKSRHSLVALFIAIAVHVVLITLLWRSDTTRHDHHKIIPRFGIQITQESVVKETLSEPVISQKTPDVSRQTVLPSAPVHANPSTDPAAAVEQLYTPSDSDVLPPSIIHHYGEKFFELSPGEQHYIIDHLQRIRKINEIVGTKLLRERPDDEIDPSDNNIVEFTLHPDGTISDLHLQKNRIGTPLDELTLQTINLAHTKYPKPEQETLIRIRVYILVK